MGEAILWGAVAAAPLFVGALIALLHTWPPKWLGIVLGFGAGALMASIAFELWEEGLDLAGPVPLVIGVAVVCALATIAGFALADAVGPEFRAGASGCRWGHRQPARPRHPLVS